MVDLNPAAECGERPSSSEPPGSAAATVTPPTDVALAVSDLRVAFESPHGLVRAVNGVSFSIRRGETVGILGESGSGKSVSVSAVMGLLDRPPAHITGDIRFRGVDLLRAPARETRRIRGNRISMVFQDPVTALNPSLTVGYQIGELFRVHRPGTSRRHALREAVELMDRVGIPSARERVHGYPHELSGGMSQRIMIAMAIALKPDILIADEPTTALDVTVQAQIMALLAELRRETGMALILITHDVGVVSECTEQVMVMYAGRIVESGPTGAIPRAAGPSLYRGTDELDAAGGDEEPPARRHRGRAAGHDRHSPRLRVSPALRPAAAALHRRRRPRVAGGRRGARERLSLRRRDGRRWLRRPEWRVRRERPGIRRRGSGPGPCCASRSSRSSTWSSTIRCAGACSVPGAARWCAPWTT